MLEAARRKGSAVPPPSFKINIPMKILLQDIQSALAFFCTLVKNPNTDDYMKFLGNAIYTRTTHMTFTIWVNSSYAVHQ